MVSRAFCCIVPNKQIVDSTGSSYVMKSSRHEVLSPREQYWPTHWPTQACSMSTTFSCICSCASNVGC